jgi:hypothetical protein
MRNSTKKITAIAAALLLSVSGVATTAAMATPVFAEITVAAPESNIVEATDTASYTATVDTTKLYKLNGAAYEDNDLKGTYNFGNAVNPLEGKDVYVKVDLEGSGFSSKSVYIKADSVVYTNNTDVTDEAYVTVYFNGSETATTTELSENIDVTASVSGNFSIKTKIQKLDISTATIAKQATAVWTGGEISLDKADLQLYITVDGESVALDSDLYTITQVGGATATEKNGVVTFKYTGTPEATSVTYKLTDAAYKNLEFGASTQALQGNALLKITTADWSDVTIVAEDQISVSKANVTVTLNGNKLTEGTHYTVTPSSVAGDTTIAKVTVKSASTYFGKETSEVYYVNIGKNIATKITSVTLTDKKTTSYTYTGEEIKPDVTVKQASGASLTEGVDYEIVYENNVNVGTNTASYYVKGIGDYAGTVTGGTFTIKAQKLSDTTVTAEDVTYETTLPTVADLAKAITVKNGDVELVYGTDYTISVNGSIKEGANTVKILKADDNDNYIGSTTATVNVVKVADISTAEIAAIANVAYTGEAQTPALTVTLGDKTLVQDTDYTVEYTNNTEVGKATATITGIGAYTGTATKNFVIVPQQVTGLKAIKKTTTTLKLQFNAVKGADGYKIYDAETNKAIASVSTQNGADVLKKTITGLNAGETRKYKVRAYKIVNGTKRYAEFSAVYTKATAKK